MRKHRDKWMEDTSDEHDRLAKEYEHCENSDDNVEVCGAALGQPVILCVLGQGR